MDYMDYNDPEREDIEIMRKCSRVRERFTLKNT
jgi:hypothetical protein